MDHRVNTVLFVQDSSPCIRTIKMANALRMKGFNIHLVHRNKTPDEVYGYGNEAFLSMKCLPQNRHQDLRSIASQIQKYGIELIHYHNQPDVLGAKLIQAKLGAPVIYDQHDFMSFKHRLTRREKTFERICNEQSDGAIYVTESYKSEVSKYYSLVDNSITFSNYFSEAFLLDKEYGQKNRPQHDRQSHFVYVGRISEHRKDHRNIIQLLKQMAKKGCAIHVYPSKTKPYRKFEKLTHVTMHQPLPYRDLIREISQYDFGLTIFNDAVASTLPHIRYALGNKTFDYLCAGLPILTQGCLDEVKNIVIQNGFGFIIEDDHRYIGISKEQYDGLIRNIQEKRGRFTVEHQIDRLIRFYQTTREKFDSHAEAT